MAMRLDKKPESVGMMANNLKEYETVRDFFTSGTMVMLIDLPFAILFIAVIFLISGWLAFIPLVAVADYHRSGLVAAKTAETHHRSDACREQPENTRCWLKPCRVSKRSKPRVPKAGCRDAGNTSSRARRKPARKPKKIGTLATGLTQYIMNFDDGRHRRGRCLHDQRQVDHHGCVDRHHYAGRTRFGADGIRRGFLLLKYQQSRISLQSLHKIMETPSERPHDKVFPSCRRIAGFRRVSECQLRLSKPAGQSVGRCIVHHSSRRTRPPFSARSAQANRRSAA